MGDNASGRRDADSGPVLRARVRRRQKLRNAVQALLLLGGLVVLAAGLAWMFFGRTGLVLMLVFGAVLLFVRPRVPTRAVLSMYGARPLPYAAAPELHHIVEALAERARLRAVPALYYVRSPMINAFAVGRRPDAALAVTDGLLRELSSRQLARCSRPRG